MKHIIAFIFILFTPIIFWGQEKDLIEWKSIQKADSLQLNGDSRFIFVDVYTDWCGPCKLMDKYTFHNEKVAQYINKNFIPVKLNAEANKEIIFKGKQYKWINDGRNGIQSLAYFILGGQLRYPSMPIIDSNGKTLTIISGYFKEEEFLEVIQNIKQQLDENYVKEQ